MSIVMGFSMLHHVEDADSVLLYAFFVTLSRDELLNVDIPKLKPVNMIKDLLPFAMYFKGMF